MARWHDTMCKEEVNLGNYARLSENTAISWVELFFEGD